ncbi:MAG: hypothetical protein K2X55_07570 [Burkholderiaceae bacterium]|nr:hypothetical protein [Burkholderiaceae bacterium]
MKPTNISRNDALAATIAVPKKLPANQLECIGVVEGFNNDCEVPVQISARCLPKAGEKLRTLCAWPRLTANGLRPDGDLHWCDITVADSVVRLKKVK